MYILIYRDICIYTYNHACKFVCFYVSMFLCVLTSTYIHRTCNHVYTDIRHQSSRQARASSSTQHIRQAAAPLARRLRPYTHSRHHGQSRAVLRSCQPRPITVLSPSLRDTSNHTYIHACMHASTHPHNRATELLLLYSDHLPPTCISRQSVIASMGPCIRWAVHLFARSRDRLSS
jgi:hypothetical protein